MKKEEKDLLIKDLCGRLPYDIKVKRPVFGDPDYVSVINIDAGTLTVVYNGYTNKIEKFVPYLRPMSSMTEKQKNEHFGRTMTIDIIQTSKEVIDWLNKKMFDYRGLIEKGLALEAPNGMYK